MELHAPGSLAKAESVVGLEIMEARHWALPAAGSASGYCTTWAEDLRRVGERRIVACGIRTCAR